MTFHPLRTCANICRQTLSLSHSRHYRRLQIEFGFDPWHVASPFVRRPYKKRVVAMVDSFAPHTVVEIGCGLGEIISRAKAPVRFGFDREAAVVRAAAHLHGPHTSFLEGDLCRPEMIAEAVGGPIDVLIAVNWPHMLAFELIEAAIRELATHSPVRRLVIDTIHYGCAGYQHYHAREHIARLGEVTRTIPGGDHIRDLHAVTLSQ